MKLIWCSGLTWIYGHLEEGWGQSVMKIMQCNGLPGIHAQLTWGVHQPKQVLSAKCELIYVSCFGVVVLHESMDNWRRGAGVSLS